MPTPLTDAIQALTRYANETTGQSDTTLSDAVATLVEGYGQGGGTEDWRKKDGNTYLHISIPSKFLLTVNMAFSQSIASGNTIEWGDGTSTVPTNTSSSLVSHTYEAVGDYIIKITNRTGTFWFGKGSTLQGFMFQDGVEDTYVARVIPYNGILVKAELGNGWYEGGSRQFVSCKRLKKVYFGKQLTSATGSFMFESCDSLSEITGVDNWCAANIGRNWFNGCRALDEFFISPTQTEIGWYTYCHTAITKIEIPQTVTIIRDYAFNDCQQLTSVTIPSSVTTINRDAFSACLGLHEIHMLGETPPTLNNTNAFPLLNTNANRMYRQVLYVPYSADHSVLEAYKTANNWSSYASYIEEEPQG